MKNDKIYAMIIIIKHCISRFFWTLRDKQRGYNRLWEWFGLSRAGFLIIPRVLMHEMSDKWQWKMSKLLEEYDETWDFKDYNLSTSVTFKENGKIVSPPDIFCNYRHPYYEDIDKIKRKK